MKRRLIDLFSLCTVGEGVSFQRRREGDLFLEAIVYFYLCFFFCVFLMLSLVWDGFRSYVFVFGSCLLVVVFRSSGSSMCSAVFSSSV